jgi:pyruvate dehydrogenase E1 component beta subunit
MKAVVPSNPIDAKGLLLAAIEDDDPVIYIEHRWMHEDEADVPQEYYVTPIGKGHVVRRGSDVTVVAIGTMVSEAMKAAAALERFGLSVEIVDPRTIHPLDTELILDSVSRTGRLVVADADWGPCGLAGEIIARVTERAFGSLKSAPARVVWPDTSVPSSQEIEKQFYPGAREIEQAVMHVCEDSRAVVAENTVKQFVGPF